MSTTEPASVRPPPLSVRSQREWHRRRKQLAYVTNPFTVWQLQRELEQLEHRGGLSG